MLEIRGLEVSVAGQKILRGLDLKVNAGEVHAIMGPNGSGKSTLANVLAGREGYEVDAGEVISNGQNLFSWTPKSARAKAFFWRFSIPWRFPASATPIFSKPPSMRFVSIAARRRWTRWNFSP